ncbi:hypothetical protein I6U48_26545 [Clostridium sp. PL3]|uniref:Uncharacterized protein n=1 Tax=Clostridium thailandense TaxID=2794346 RepID=A0A949TP73_9CLOT|nr:hypothetical protein [Clostridium thailandense]MBV7276444.1 hypothetical protein [Clostridium thailandense]
MNIRKVDKHLKKIKIKDFKKLKRFIKTKNFTKGEITMENTMVRPCTPAESLKQSLIEMKLMREGKMDKRSYWDAMKDFDDDEDEDEE